MIGSALKKFAQQNGLTVDKGIAYGSLNGIAVTLCEGSGWKQMTYHRFGRAGCPRPEEGIPRDGI